MSQFENSPHRLEGLEEMRDSVDDGVRMNRRLHSSPFRQLQEFVAYEAAFDAPKCGE